MYSYIDKLLLCSKKVSFFEVVYDITLNIKNPYRKYLVEWQNYIFVFYKSHLRYMGYEVRITCYGKEQTLPRIL